MKNDNIIGKLGTEKTEKSITLVHVAGMIALPVVVALASYASSSSIIDIQKTHGAPKNQGTAMHYKKTWKNVNSYFNFDIDPRLYK